MVCLFTYLHFVIRVGFLNAGRCLCCVLLVGIVGEVEAQVELTFPDVTIEDDGEIRLKAFDARSELRPFELSAASVESEKVDGFLLSVDGAEVEFNPPRIDYVFYLEHPDGQSFRIVVRGFPSGSFLPTTKEVDFWLIGNGVDSRGSIDLPIYSLSPPDFVHWTNEQEMFEVQLGADRHYTLRLSNELEKLAAVVRKSGTLPSPASWHLRLEHRGREDWDRLTLMPRSNTGTTLQLVARPSLPAAVQQIFRRGPHLINVPLEYQVGQSAPIPLTLPVKVRFVPSLFTLVTALLLGVLLGATPRFIIDQQSSWRRWPSDVVTSFLLAVGLWILAVFAYWKESRFVLFGYSVDPNDILSVLVGAWLVGLGPQRIWRWIQDKLPFGKEP